MMGTPSLADLMAECNAHGIRLLPDGVGGLTIDAPHGALTPALLARLKSHKRDVLALLGRIDSPDRPLVAAEPDRSAEPSRPEPRTALEPRYWRHDPGRGLWIWTAPEAEGIDFDRGVSAAELRALGWLDSNNDTERNVAPGRRPGTRGGM
jgi:hypothetical protein